MLCRSFVSHHNVQVRKLISRLLEQLKQFWPAWPRFDSGFGFVVSHKAHVAINSTNHAP